MKKIPDKEEGSVLGVYWQLLCELESKTQPDKDPWAKLLVEGAYNVLNRINYTDARPRWEKKP